MVSLRSPAPRVSVVIAAYNAARWLERAVTSVVAQEGIVPAEIIVVDDCSDDATVKVAEKLRSRHSQLKLRRNPRNLGPAGTRNRGIAAATGTWTAILDADDAFAPERLARLIGVAEAQGARIVADLPVFYDLAAGQPEDRQPTTSGGISRLSVADFLRPDAESGIDLGLLKPVFHRSLVEAGLWHYPEGIRHGEDFALYLALLRSGEEFLLLREAHYLFSTRIGALSGRFSPGSVTAVDYHAVADGSAQLLEDMRSQGDLTPEIERLLEERISRARRANRIYGWTILRKGDLRRLAAWMRTPRNRHDLLVVMAQKAKGKRGLPE